MKLDPTVRLYLRAAIGRMTPQELKEYLKVIYKNHTFIIRKKKCP